MPHTDAMSLGHLNLWEVANGETDGVMIVDISGRILLGEESAALRDLVCVLLRNGQGIHGISASFHLG
jgi:hypothetical protein